MSYTLKLNNGRRVHSDEISEDSVNRIESRYGSTVCHICHKDEEHEIPKHSLGGFVIGAAIGTILGVSVQTKKINKEKAKRKTVSSTKSTYSKSKTATPVSSKPKSYLPNGLVKSIDTTSKKRITNKDIVDGVNLNKSVKIPGNNKYKKVSKDLTDKPLSSQTNYLPKRQIASVNTTYGRNIKREDILDGAYIKKGAKFAEGGSVDEKLYRVVGKKDGQLVDITEMPMTKADGERWIKEQKIENYYKNVEVIPYYGSKPRFVLPKYAEGGMTDLSNRFSEEYDDLLKSMTPDQIAEQYDLDMRDGRSDSEMKKEYIDYRTRVYPYKNLMDNDKFAEGGYIKGDDINPKDYVLIKATSSDDRDIIYVVKKSELQKIPRFDSLEDKASAFVDVINEKYEYYNVYFKGLITDAKEIKDYVSGYNHSAFYINPLEPMEDDNLSDSASVHYGFYITNKPVNKMKYAEGGMIDVNKGDKIRTTWGETFYVVYDYRDDWYWVTKNEEDRYDSNALGYTLMKSDIAEVVDEHKSWMYAEGGSISSKMYHVVNARQLDMGSSRPVVASFDTRSEAIEYAKDQNRPYDADVKMFIVMTTAQLKAEGIEEFARGGFVGKGELVWRKLSSSKRMEFLNENFTPEITPRSQEILVGKSYDFLPKKVKDRLNSKYADIEEYAEGGNIEGFTKDKIFTKGDISVQRIGGSSMWNVAIKGKSVGRILDAQTYEYAIKKAEKEFSNKLSKGGMADYDDYSDGKQYARGGISKDDSPKIYVADLAAYNEGKLIGKWLDLTNYDDADDLMSAIHELMAKFSKDQGVEREEWAIHDYENIPSNLASEYMGREDFEIIYDLINAADDRGVPYEVLAEAMAIKGEDDAERVADNYYGEFDSFKDFAYNLVDETGISNINNLDFYFDYESFGSDERINMGSEEEEEMGYEDMSDEDLGYELVEQMGGLDNLSQQTIEMYFDYDKFARELEFDYDEIRMNGNSYIFFSSYKRGGVAGKSRYNSGWSWKMDRAKQNFKETYERPMEIRKRRNK